MGSTVADKRTNCSCCTSIADELTCHTGPRQHRDRSAGGWHDYSGIIAGGWRTSAIILSFMSNVQHCGHMCCCRGVCDILELHAPSEMISRANVTTSAFSPK